MHIVAEFLEVLFQQLLMLLSPAITLQVHQQNVNRSGSNKQSSQTLWASSPVLLSIFRCSQTPLELSKVLSDCARACSGAPESTCSYGGALRILRALTYRIEKFGISGDLCTDLWQTLTAALGETSRTARTATQHCGRLGAIFSQVVLT